MMREVATILVGLALVLSQESWPQTLRTGVPSGGVSPPAHDAPGRPAQDYALSQSEPGLGASIGMIFDPASARRQLRGEYLSLSVAELSESPIVHRLDVRQQLTGSSSIGMIADPAGLTG